MNRIEVLQRIDALTDGHCRSCSERPSQDPKHYRRRQAYCNSTCEIGKQLRELGRYLHDGVTNRRKEKGVDGVAFALTKEQLLDELQIGKTLSDIANEQGVTSANISYYIKKWNIRNEVDEIMKSRKKSDKKDELTPQETEDIIRLRNELSKTIEERDQYHQALSELKESVANKDVAIKYWKTEHRKVSNILSQAGKAEDRTMSLDHYQKLASRTAETDWDQISIRLVRDPRKLKLLCFALGAAGEAGELANEIKKVIFHGHAYDPDVLHKEIGDTLWYLSQLALACGYSFEGVAKQNIEKLKERYPEGFSEEASIERRDVVAGGV